MTLLREHSTEEMSRQQEVLAANDGAAPCMRGQMLSSRSSGEVNVGAPGNDAAMLLLPWKPPISMATALLLLLLLAAPGHADKPWRWPESVVERVHSSKRASTEILKNCRIWQLRMWH